MRLLVDDLVDLVRPQTEKTRLCCHMAEHLAYVQCCSPKQSELVRSQFSLRTFSPVHSSRTGPLCASNIAVRLALRVWLYDVNEKFSTNRAADELLPTSGRGDHVVGELCGQASKRIGHRLRPP